MSEETRVYKGQKSYNAALLAMPVVLGLVLILGNSPMTAERGIGYLILSGMAVLVAVIPIGSRLEIGSDFVRSRFFDFVILEIKAKDVLEIKYGPLMRGHMGYGKGLIIQAVLHGKNRSTSLGERLYGKEAIAQAKMALEK